MKIACVEDDPIQRKTVSSWLEEAGHHCTCFDTSAAYLADTLESNNFDLMLLDWGMPDFSGLDLLCTMREKRGQTLPVMFLTCRDEEKDIVTALKNGADDYLVKPARKNELLARIEALARRRIQPISTPSLRRFGPLELDLRSRQLRNNGQLLTLTQKEFSLAHFMLDNLGQLITRQELLAKVWRQSANINTRTVDTHISRLRKKLELTPENGWQLTAVYQYGYRLDRLEREFS